MTVLVTGSSGHLGEGLMRVLPDAVGVDLLPGPYTRVVGDLADRAVVRRALDGVDAVIHAATLHKPHVGSHSRRDFVDANVTATLNLLEEAVGAGVGRFVFTSTTSAFGRALTPGSGEPAAWITEDVVPRPRNVYGVTKTAAEELCELVHRDHGLPVVILRTSRFFPEPDDQEERRAGYDDLNLKVNELLYRRVDLEDAVRAHLDALERAPRIAFGRYIVSATTPFTRRWWRASSPTTSASTPRAAGRCCRRSTASTTTRAPAATSAGRPASTSATRSTASPAARTRAATWRWPSAPRATTPRPPASTRPASRGVTRRSVRRAGRRGRRGPRASPRCRPSS
jgi:UDP-glucose 4-epimerase